MNKVIQVNLGGYAFTLDQEAYDRLDTYLAKLNRYFRDSVGQADIMHDIEARLSELFRDSLRGRQVVIVEDVRAAIATLGTPEAMTENEPEPEPQFGHARPRYTHNHMRTGKRLYRDPEEKVIAGVMGGLAAYLGVPDPIWLRILGVLALFATGGGAAVVYIVMWAIVPYARTSGERLAMRGEDVNIDNIASSVEREVQDIASRINDWGQEVGRGNWRGKGSGQWSQRPTREPYRGEDGQTSHHSTSGSTTR